jgi:hypothetical protein
VTDYRIKLLDTFEGTGLLADPPIRHPDVGDGFWDIWDPLTTGGADGAAWTLTGPGTGVPDGSIGDIDNTGGSGAFGETFTGLAFGTTYEVGDEFYTDFTWGPDNHPGLDEGHICAFSILMHHTPLNTDRQAERGWFEMALWSPYNDGGTMTGYISFTSFTLGNFWDVYDPITLPWEWGEGKRIGLTIVSNVRTGPDESNPNTYNGVDENWDMVLEVWTEPHGGGTRTVLGTVNANLPHNWLEHQHFLLYTLTVNPCPNYTCEEVCIRAPVQCEGDPGGPNPYPFPPPPPDPVKGLWVMSPVGEWEFLQLPNPTDPSTDLQVYANLVPRDVQDVKVWANGLWRDLVDQNYGNQYDPPDIYPPYYDPCEELPPTEDPPDVVLGTPPDRLFFTWAISASQLGGLWTATFRAMSPGIVTEINQAAARGGAVFGTPGDKTKFFTGGRYDPSKMDAFIESFAPIKTFLLDAQDAGSFAGLHAADDWENGAKWGGRPLPLSEINRIAAKWKTVITDGSRQVRVMIRARSGQLYQELPNLDGLISQMRMTGAEWDAAGRDPAQYAIIELNYCMARGWILHLSQNFFHGPGSVTAIMSPTDILTNGLAWDDVIRSHPWGGKVLGEGGWEFVSPITTGPYLNVLGDWRNDYQTLGPPS